MAKKMSVATTNGIDPDKLKSFVGRIEELQSEKASEKGSFMKRCQEINDDIKAVYQEAKDELGLSKKALKANIKRRELENKIEDLRNELEGEEQEIYDQIAHALGVLADTELGRAALASAGGVKAGVDALKDLASEAAN